MNAFETKDRFKQFENVEAVKRTDLEIKEGDPIVLHNGLPVSPTTTGRTAVKAAEAPPPVDRAAVKAAETPPPVDRAAVKAAETKDLSKQFENVEAVKMGDKIALHNGLPVSPASQDITAVKAAETPTPVDTTAVKAVETPDLSKQFENVAAVKRGDKIALHDGLPVSSTSTDRTAVKAAETPTSTERTAVKAVEAPPPVDRAAVKAAETPPPVDRAAVKAAETPPPVDSAAVKAAETPTPVDTTAVKAAVKAVETPDLSKQFENVEAVKGIDLEIEEEDIIVLHNGLPVSSTPTDRASVKAAETPTSTERTAVKAVEAPPPVDRAAVKAAETPPPVDRAAVKAAETPPPVDSAAVKAIETQGLVKRFENVEAVKGIDLEIGEGELFGLLGPNGAGKTTTISMLCTIVRPTSGAARVYGHDVKKEPDIVRGLIGIVFQDPSLDDNLTGRENLDFHGRLYKVPRSDIAKRISEVLELVELSDKADVIVKKYSGGMKRRLEIARGLLHHPKVLFLDEPTLGLDPQTRRHIWEYIERLNREQKITMILTTHYMDEADQLCDRIAIIDHGKIVAMDTPDNLKHDVGGDVVIMTVPNDGDKLKTKLEQLELVKSTQLVDGTLRLSVEKGETAIPVFMEVARQEGVLVPSISLHEPTLEDIFIKYTGREIRAQEAAGGLAGLRVPGRR